MTAPAKTATKSTPSKAAKSTAKTQGAAKSTAPAKEAKPRKQAAPKPIKHCLDGCGAQTKGGDFVIGHDAKLKSVLQKEHVAGAKALDLGGKDASRYHGMSPMDVAKERGWEKYLEAAKTRADEKANRPKRTSTKKVKGGPVEVGTRVEFTYRGAKRSGEVKEVSGERAKVEFDVDGKTETRAFGKESLTAITAA